MSSADPLVVLVHGAWHGAWAWAPLQAALDARGIPSLAIDLPGHGTSPEPLTDLAGDAAALTSLVVRLGRPVVLVGHSYGGAVITEAACDPDVAALTRHLVYVAAFALTAGESVLDVVFSVQPAPTALAGAVVDGGDGTTSVDPASAVAAFYADCPPAAATAAIARLDRQSAASFSQRTSGSPLGVIASTYVRCTSDEAVHLSHQDLMAARCDHVVTLDTDHSPFLGRPDETAAVIAAVVAAENAADESGRGDR